VAIPVHAVQARQARARRFGALLLDLIAFSILAAVVNGVYGVTQVTSGSLPNGQVGAFSYSTVTSVGWAWLCLLWIAYYIVPEALFGASLGKMFTRLCVVRVDGRPVGVGSIVTRNVLRFVDVLPGLYFIGGILVLLTGSSQRLGDVFARTTVVKREHALEPWATRHPPRGANRMLGTALVLALVVTVAFDYFGRPALVIQGMYNTQQLLMRGVASYSLGQPRWGFGEVTYPITVATTQDSPFNGGKTCQGSIQLQWGWIEGWNAGSSGWDCR
jgi:uncharacterized RDD family membrane protein YckC